MVKYVDGMVQGVSLADLKASRYIEYLDPDPTRKCMGSVSGKPGVTCRRPARWEFTWPTLAELRAAKKENKWRTPDSHLRWVRRMAGPNGKSFFCISHLIYRGMPWGSMEMEDLFYKSIKEDAQ